MHDDQPVVSVGIPTFNRPEGLRRSLECICRQTYPNLEIIVSDNASPGEETQRVVEEFMKRDGRIRYFRQPTNLGPVANFQFVLDVSTGKYFMWLADDDWRAPRYIEALLNELQSDHDAAIAFCDIAVFDEKGDKRKDFYPTYLPYLSRFEIPNPHFRRARYFLQDENLGKANLVYGLMRGEAIKAIRLDTLQKKYGFYGLDNLIIYVLLERGGVRLVKDQLYGCTAGNMKHYPADPVSSRRMRRLHSIGGHLRYLMAYPRLSKGMMRIVLAALFPIKVTMFYFHIIKRKIDHSELK